MRCISVLVTLTLGLSLAARASAADQQITITAGKSFVIDSPADVERVAVGSEDVIEAVAITQREIMLNGKAPGETSLIVWLRNGGGRQSYDITVEPSQARLDTLRRRMHSEINPSIEVEQDDKSILLHGSVKNQAEGDRAMTLAGMLGKPVNLLTLATPPAPQQILLKVRFANVDRSASMSLGMNLFSTGAGKTIGSATTQQFSPPSPGNVTSTTGGAIASQFNLSNALNLFLFRPDLNLGATIEALEANNLVQILAEPNVLATAGKEASFLAGGEFPYPVVQSSANGVNNVTILFREFGIRLTFIATVTPRGTIHLEVAPEVSSLDYANGLTYQGFNIPGLSVRRVKTDVEVENNQSFAIAGLLDNRVTENLSKVPGLGSIPLFGKLFQSRSTSRSNSELMVVVTPELVKPMPAGAAPQIEMPKPFMKDGATALPAANPPDTREIPVLLQVPYLAPNTKDAPAATPADALGALQNAFGSKK